MNVKKQFPIYNEKSNKDFVYLDSASTTLKHQKVIAKLTDYYSNYSANIHRSVYPIAEKATNEFEITRLKISKFINAKKEEVIFTKNATESINLVAYSWGLKNLNKDDVILISKMEHHSNIIPWQFVAKQTGCKLKYIPLLKDGSLNMNEFNNLLTTEVKLVSLIHQSNVLGIINPIKDVIEKAHLNNSLVMIDAAQSISHIEIDVKKLDCDFLVFSGHKMFGPTSVGVLYGKYNLLDEMDPFIYGGQMIDQVNKYDSSWNKLPLKFEAGTPNIGEVISLGESVDFIQELSFKKINNHLKSLISNYVNVLNKYDDIQIYGDIENRGPVISFNIKNIHAYDFCQIMGQHNISLRAGNHCAQPLLEHFGTTSTIRASFHVYNTLGEINYFEKKLKQTIDMLK